jgi:AcrR family transcriptional regulator
MSGTLTRTGRAYRGISEEDRKADRREKLVDAGLRVFGDVGYGAATVKAICQASGLTERYFYESFENREQFFAAVYEDLIGRIRQAVLGALLSAQGGDVARAGLKAFLVVLRDDKRLARIILLEVTRAGGRLDAHWRGTVEEFVAVIEGVVPAVLGTAAEERQYDRHLLVAGFLGSLLNIATTWYLSGFKKPVDAVVEHAVLQVEAMRFYFAEKSKPVKKK